MKLKTLKRKFIVILLELNLPIPKRIQVAILQLALNQYDECDIDNSSIGLCRRIYSAVDQYLGMNYFAAKQVVPSFNFNNCLRLSKKYSFLSPYKGAFWWPLNYEGNNARKECLVALINELKK